jgi:hypothetical protein
MRGERATVGQLRRANGANRARGHSDQRGTKVCAQGDLGIARSLESFRNSRKTAGSAPPAPLAWRLPNPSLPEQAVAHNKATP